MNMNELCSPPYPYPDDRMFMGLTPAEISELKVRADKLDVTDLIREVAALKGKLSAYERAFDRIDAVRKATT